MQIPNATICSHRNGRNDKFYIMNFLPPPKKFLKNEKRYRKSGLAHKLGPKKGTLTFSYKKRQLPFLVVEFEVPAQQDCQGGIGCNRIRARNIVCYSHIASI